MIPGEASHACWDGDVTECVGWPPRVHLDKMVASARASVMRLSALSERVRCAIMMTRGRCAERTRPTKACMDEGVAAKARWPIRVC